MCLCIVMYVCVYLCSRMCLCSYVYVCVCVYVRECAYLFVYIYMCVGGGGNGAGWSLILPDVKYVEQSSIV